MAVIRLATLADTDVIADFNFRLAKVLQAPCAYRRRYVHCGRRRRRHRLLHRLLCCTAQETEDLELDVPTVRAGVASLLSDVSKGRYYVVEVDGAVVAQLMITLEWSDWRNMQAGFAAACPSTCCYVQQQQQCGRTIV